MSASTLKAEKVLAEKTGAVIQSAFLQITDSKGDEFEVLRIMRSLAKRTPADRSIETLTENVESLMQTRDTQETQNVFRQGEGYDWKYDCF